MTKGEETIFRYFNPEKIFLSCIHYISLKGVTKFIKGDYRLRIILSPILVEEKKTIGNCSNINACWL